MIAFSLVGAEKRAPTVDVLIGLTLAFDEAYERREQRVLGSTSVCLASLEDMIALKRQAGREQDIADLEHLLRYGKSNG